MKKILLVSAAIIALGAGGAIALNSDPKPTKAVDSPLVQQTNRNTEELNNHEDRITNNERNIGDLQNKTNTPSNPVNITPRIVTTTPVSQPVTNADLTPIVAEPIKVTSGSQTLLGSSGEWFCDLTYSDGTALHKSMGTYVDVSGNPPPDTCGQFVGQVK